MQSYVLRNGILGKAVQAEEGQIEGLIELNKLEHIADDLDGLITESLDEALPDVRRQDTLTNIYGSRQSESEWDKDRPSSLCAHLNFAQRTRHMEIVKGDGGNVEMKLIS